MTLNSTFPCKLWPSVRMKVKHPFSTRWTSSAVRHRISRTLKAYQWCLFEISVQDCLLTCFSFPGAGQIVEMRWTSAISEKWLWIAYYRHGYIYCSLSIKSRKKEYSQAEDVIVLRIGKVLSVKRVHVTQSPGSLRCLGCRGSFRIYIIEQE